MESKSFYSPENLVRRHLELLKRTNKSFLELVDTLNVPFNGVSKEEAIRALQKHQTEIDTLKEPKLHILAYVGAKELLRLSDQWMMNSISSKTHDDMCQRDDVLIFFGNCQKLRLLNKILGDALEMKLSAANE